MSPGRPCHKAAHVTGIQSVVLFILTRRHPCIHFNYALISFVHLKTYTCMHSFIHSLMYALIYRAEDEKVN